MRQPIGAEAPKELAARTMLLLWLGDPDLGVLVIVILPPEPGSRPTSSTGY